MDHLNFRIQLIKELLETHGRAVETRQIGRPSKTHMPVRITDTSLTTIEKKAKPYKRCIVCCKRTGIRKETAYWCKECGVGLCAHNCFRVYRTEVNL